jgi:hypothetical protein
MATKPTQVSNEVVVQIVEAPKAEYVVQVSEAQQLDICVELFSDGEATIAEGDDGIQKSALILGKVLLPDASVPCTYAKWNVIRSTWLRKYMAFNSHASEESAQKAWERQVRRTQKEMPDLVKPKAPSASAQKMSEKRKAEVEMLGKLDDDQLVDLLVAYKNQDNFTKANGVKAEMKRRNADAESEVNAERKALREHIRKQIAQTMDIELLRSVSAMLPALVTEVPAKV